MKDSMYLSCTTPFEETGIQMDMPDFDVKAITEGKLFIQQIIDHYGNPPDGGELKVKANDHDFGVYYSIEYYWDDTDPEAFEYGLNVEGDILDVLSYWDKDKKDLAKGIVDSSEEELHRVEVEALRNEITELNKDLNFAHGKIYGRV